MRTARCYQRGFRGFGAEGPVPAADAQVEPGAPVGDRTPPYTRQALSLMGVAAIPWVPVVAGAWIGDRTVRENGKLWGAAAGFTLSFLTLRYYTKKFNGGIT